MCRFDPFDFPGPNDFYSFVFRIARKPHKCEECWREIRRGERYRLASGKMDSRMWSAKTCAHCDIPRQWLEANCDGYLYSQVIGDFMEHAEANMPMLRIVAGARRKWRSFGDPAQLLPIPVYPQDMD